MYHIQQKINIFKRLWITFYHLDEAHVFVPFRMKFLTTSRLSTSCGLLQMETQAPHVVHTFTRNNNNVTNMEHFNLLQIGQG